MFFDFAAITGIAAGPLSPEGADAASLPAVTLEIAEAYFIHQAIPWAFAVTGPVVVLFDCAAAGHAAEGANASSVLSNTIVNASRCLSAKQ